LTPRSGYYQGGEFKFKITLPDTYPNKAPTISALTKMYHPNISFSGNICLNILSSDFNPSYRLEHYINALLWLLLNPNFDSQLNGSVKKDTYAFDVVLSMRGFPVGGTTFEKTMVACNDNWEPSEELKRTIFQCLYSSFTSRSPKGSIQEFLNDGASQEWVNFEPGLQRMLNMGLQGFFVPRNSLQYVPQNAILKNSVWTLSEKPILILTGSYNLGKVSKELVAKFLEAKEEDLNEISSNFPNLCGTTEDKISIFSSWNKFDRILINDNVFTYETVVVPSWYPQVYFQIKSSVFKAFPDSKIGTFTSQNAGAIVASTSTVDSWYQTMRKTMSIQEFLNEPLVKDWVQYDPLTLFFTQNGITGDLMSTSSIHEVPDDVWVKQTLWTYGENAVLVLSAESEKREFSKDLLAKALGVPSDVLTSGNSDSLFGCSLNRLVPFCLPEKVSRVLINEELFTHEQIAVPLGSSTYLSTNPAIFKLIKNASFVPLSAPRTNLNFPKKALFQQWTQAVVQQPDKNVITVKDVLDSKIASKWRKYDPTAEYLTELGLLDLKFVSRESERCIPDELIARQVAWLADGKVVTVVHNEKQDPSAQLVAEVLGLPLEKIEPVKDADYQNVVGASKANFTIFYPTSSVTRMLVSETLVQHKFTIVPITQTLSLQVPTNVFASWKDTIIGNICPPKQVQRKSVFNEWYSKYASNSIAAFLKTPHVADWGAYDPTTRMLQELQIDGKWRSAVDVEKSLPDEVLLKQYVFLADGVPTVIIAARTPNSIVNKELVAKALGTTPDKITQADLPWYDSVGVSHAAFSVFNPVIKAKIVIDAKVMQQPIVIIASGHNPLFQIKSEMLLKLPNAEVAPLTCEKNEHSETHIVDRLKYAALTQKQKRIHDKKEAEKKCLLLNWINSMKNGQGRVKIETLAQSAIHADFFEYEPTIGLLLKLGVQGDFIVRGMDAQKIASRAAQCKMTPNQVLKELVWIADGKVVLALSNGDDPIDADFLARAVGCNASQLSRPKKNELEAVCGLPPQLVSAFSPLLKVDKIVVNQRILELAEVSTSAGRPELSLIIKPEVFTRLPNVIVADLVNPAMVEEIRQRREREATERANNNNNTTTPPAQTTEAPTPAPATTQPVLPTQTDAVPNPATQQVVVVALN